MNKPLLNLVFGFLIATAACGGDGGGSGDRGGPDSLIGFMWQAEPVTINGIELQFGFQFDNSTVTASATCNGSLNVDVSSPVRYRYTATVSDGDSQTEESGDTSCFVELRASSFDFEIVGNKLVASYQGETFEFSPVGSVAGLYGKWKVDLPNVGTLTWSMGNGEIESTVDCTNGLSATVVVDADFVNKVEIVEEASNTETDEFGLECSVSTTKGTSEYYFDGSTLVVVLFNGEEFRLESK